MLAHIVTMMGTREFTFNLNPAVDSNLRVAALNAGWNSSSKVTAILPSGLTLLRTLFIDGAFPNGVALINNGQISGGGGLGGGGGFGSSPGSSGGDGGDGLNVSVPVTITNNGGIYAGGGGGGGGGGSVDSGGSQGAGGFGGLGARLGSPAGPGSTATSPAGNGGAGGPIATAGSFGLQGFDVPAGTPTGRGSAGNAGFAVRGNTNITWIATGTRVGAIV